MASSINALTAAGGGIAMGADASGILQLQSAGTATVTVDTSGNVGIGTSSPVTPLTVASSTTLASGSPSILLTGESNTERIQVRAAGGAIAGSPVVATAASRGTVAVPTAIQSGDNLGYYQFGGHNGTAFTRGAWITGTADGAYSATNSGSNLSFSTTPNGSTTIAERMRIDSSGNVGIGTPSPGKKLQVAGTTDQLSLTTGINELLVRASSTEVALYTFQAIPLNFYTNNAERMRIDSSGNLLVGKSSGSATTVGNQFGLVGAGYNESVSTNVGGTLALWYLNRQSSVGEIFNFRQASTPVGTISVTASTTAYNTSSDYRLKNTIAPMTGALDKVALLKPCTYKWNADNSDGQGFIAHELDEVVQGCVSGEKDATREEEYEVSPAVPAVVDAEGVETTPAVQAVKGTRTVPSYQGVDTSFLVATLTAAIQEQQAMIIQLQADVATLKGLSA
jgi:hypothetical protein